MVNLPAVSSASISVISLEETLIVAPLANVMLVVLLPPFIESKESILAANESAAISVSLTAMVVMLVVFENPEIFEARVVSSERLLEVRDVTLLMFTVTVVKELIEFRSEAEAAASSVPMVIVYALVPPDSVKPLDPSSIALIRVSARLAVTLPDVNEFRFLA